MEMNVRNLLVHLMYLILIPTEINGFLYVEYHDQIDFTHVNITRGALQKVAAIHIASYVEPGKYVDRQNASEILRLYFQNNPQAKDRYKTAVNEILQGLAIGERNIQQSPKYTMNNEQIEEGNRYLNEKRSLIVSLSNEKIPHLTTIRQQIGQFIYTLQEFYSNTNWIEIDGSVFENLGWNNTLGFPVAETYQPTCKDCAEPSANNPDSCIDNIISKDVLTSGYIDWDRISTGAVKPYSNNWKSGTGKCSHGGERDSSRVIHATGGINKETHSPIASPHYNLHHKAGQVATAATINFFVGNETSYVQSVGAAQLGKILGLESECLSCFGPSLSIVFVIDTTGSMGDDIRAVRVAALELVTKTIIAPSYHPYNYILVTFNDPGTLTTYKETANATIMQRWLNEISVSGGGDCPEYSMTGLVKAMTNANKGSCVMLYTDADPKDSSLKNKVRDLIISKNLHLMAFITGSCGGDLTSPDMHLKCATGGKNHRKRREVLADSFYASLGGDTFIVPDRKISKPLDKILEHNMGLKHVTTWKASLLKGNLDLFIDIHIQAFTIELKGPRVRPTDALKNPSGSDIVYTGDNKIDDLGKSTYKISIIHPVAGTWTIENMHSETWIVTVKLQGSITFMQYFLEDVHGTLLPIMGSSPLSGSNVTLKVDVEGLKEKDTVLYVHLLDNSRHEIESYNFTDYEEAGEMIGMAPIQIPDQPFKVMIHGSSDGSDYRRELADVITPSSAELHFEKTEVAVYTWKITNFTIKVENTGSSVGRYQLKLTDTSGFISSLSLITIAIEPRSSKDVTVQLKAKVLSKTSIMFVKLFVGSTELQNQQVLLMVQLSAPPDISILKQSLSCNKYVLNYSNCSKQLINSTISVTTSSGIKTAYTRPSLTTDMKHDGHNVVLKISGSCCTPKYTLFLIDNEYLQTDQEFDFTDGNIFITSLTLKVHTNSAEQQGFTTTAFYGVIGGIVATLLAVVIIGIAWLNWKTSRNAIIKFPDTKENVQNKCQKMNKDYLQYFVK